MTEFVFYGGKGGVGKTTCAAATALKLSGRGDTLVVSTDPAHSLSDSLETEVPSRPEMVMDNLWAAEVDPEEAMEGYRGAFERVPEQFGGFPGLSGGELGEGMGGLFEDALMAPGSDEAAAMHEFMKYMDSDDWDYIVFDTAPTGHTLRLLQLPEVMDSMLGRMIKIRSQIQGVVDSLKGVFGGGGEDNVSLDEFRRVKARIERVRGMLSDPEQTDFRVVSVPERMSVLETERMIERLSRFEVPVRTVVLNRVMEEVNEDCEFCSARWEVQRRNLDEAREIFRGLDIQYVPLMRGDVRGVEELEGVAENLEV